ncbi:MAG: hypothetical protein U9P49_02205 [Thermodesulfobacteriota bacterium]|nr:hypothetical protein [Thermodesulfobacteriota bacterium]
MTNNPKKIMEEAFIYVMEKMAFMFVDVPVKDEISNMDDVCFHVHMDFTGPTFGRLGLAISMKLALTIAANVMGMEPDEPVMNIMAENIMGMGPDKPIDEDLIRDAVREILNVVCGRFLTLMFGDKPVFNLSVPQISRLDAGGWGEMISRPEVNAFMVENSPVLVYARLG